MKTIVLILSLFLISCNTLELKGTTVDCEEIVTCSNNQCFKTYRGSDCSLEERERKRGVMDEKPRH